MPYVARDGLRLFYERAGGGEPPLVFVHGWCCDNTFFEPEFEHFARSHTVVALDLRGCGRSTRAAEGYDIPTLADDVAWLVDELGLTSPVVIGHSLGGMIAVEVAASHRGAVGAVVAVEPGPIDLLPDHRAFFERFATDLAGADGEKIRRQYVERVAGTTIDAERRRVVLEAMCASPIEAAAAAIRGVTAWDGSAALAGCDVPVLVILAAPGGSNAPERLRALKPDVHVGITVGSGHFNQFEVPGQVNAMIERFVDVTMA